jgi:hypothetical protein
MAFKNFRFTGLSNYNIGVDILPLSITPGDATSAAALAMNIADRGRVDVFDLGGDPESGTMAPGDVHSLRNMDRCIPQSLTEVHMHLQSVVGSVAYWLGESHLCIAVCHRFLRQYHRLQTRLEGELEFIYNRWLPPSLVTCHVTLILREWFVLHLDVEECDHLPAPYL